MTVLDLSSYDVDTLDVACMKANGVTGVILGCQRPQVARAMAMSLIGGGIPLLGVYAFLYLGIDSDGQTLEAIGVAREFGVSRVWLDVESTGENEKPGMTPTARVMEVARNVQLVRSAGMEPGIYTGRWYWVPKMANSQAFKDLPLWHSAYYPDHHVEQAVDYGGWTQCAIHQYASDIELCGRVRDHNFVFEEEEEDMTVIEDILLALYAGAEERDPDTGETLPRAQRLAAARFRASQAADGRAQSVNDTAASAAANLKKHIDTHAIHKHTVVLPPVTSEGAQ